MRKWAEGIFYVCVRGINGKTRIRSKSPDQPKVLMMNKSRVEIKVKRGFIGITKIIFEFSLVLKPEKRSHVMLEHL
jgi:hypothetical protein